MRILRVFENWIHTHFITDADQLPTERVREIERGIVPLLRELGIVYGIHLEREPSDPGIRIVLECRPAEAEREKIQRRLAEVVAPIPRRPPATTVRIERGDPSGPTPRPPRPLRPRAPRDAPEKSPS